MGKVGQVLTITILTVHAGVHGRGGVLNGVGEFEDPVS